MMFPFLFFLLTITFHVFEFLQDHADTWWTLTHDALRDCYALLGLLVVLYSLFLCLVPALQGGDGRFQIGVVFFSFHSPGLLRELPGWFFFFFLQLIFVWWLSCLVFTVSFSFRVYLRFFQGRVKIPDPTLTCGLVWSSSLLFLWFWPKSTSYFSLWKLIIMC